MKKLVRVLFCLVLMFSLVSTQVLADDQDQTETPSTVSTDTTVVTDGNDLNGLVGDDNNTPTPVGTPGVNPGAITDGTYDVATIEDLRMYADSGANVTLNLTNEITINDVNGATNEDSMIHFRGNVVIEGNGNTLNMNWFAFKPSADNASLTIQGLIMETPHDWGAISNQNPSYANVAMSVINSTINYQGNYGIVNANGSIIVENSTLNAEGGKQYPFPVLLLGSAISRNNVTITASKFPGAIAEVRQRDVNPELNYVMSPETLANYAVVSAGMRTPATLDKDIELSEAITISNASGAGIVIPAGTILQSKKVEILLV